MTLEARYAAVRAATLATPQRASIYEGRWFVFPRGPWLPIVYPTWLRP